MFIESGLIEKIETDETEFCRFITHYSEGVLADARLYPKLAKPRLIEIHGAWRNDMERIGTYEKALGEGLDHFKRSGHLAFWIRRFTPIVEAVDLTQNIGDPEGYGITDREQKFRDLLFGYVNEYVAFDVGFQFCLYYERSVEKTTERAANLQLNDDYIEMMCHFLKYKTVSPHALSVIYKSLFLA